MFTPILLPAHNPGPLTGATGNNTYLLHGASGGATLIDAGVGDARHLARIEEELGNQQATLEQVLVTHGHADHAAGAGALAARYPRARFFKHPWPARGAAFGVDWQPLDDQARVTVGAEDPLIVLHTPGHSPDHLAFWHEASGTVFTGDLIVKGGSVVIAAGGDLAQYLASLERIRSLHPRLLLPAHGPAVTDPDAVLTAHLNHRLERERQILAALGAGLQTVESIVESIYDGLGPALLPAARQTVRAHLDKLRHERRAFETDARWRA